MPKLAILPLVSDALNHFVLLVEESELCPETKVADTEEANFLEDVLSRQFDL
jgi:hypothetical protein